MADSAKFDTESKAMITLATGMTSAFVGDERSLVEPIVGAMKVSELKMSNQNVLFILINDTFDPLTKTHLKLAKKDEDYSKELEDYVGIPISNIPDFGGCHKNYAHHCGTIIYDKLKELGINPQPVTSHLAYMSSAYSRYINITLRNYDTIKFSIRNQFDGYLIKNLIAPQCPECKRLAIEVTAASGDEVEFYCDFCKTNISGNPKDLQIKLVTGCGFIPSSLSLSYIMVPQ